MVLEIDGKSTLELYNLAIGYINETYENPNAVIKGKVAGEYLRFSGYDANFMMYNNSGVKIPIQVDYQIELRFKDGKVRYEIIELDMRGSKSGIGVKFSGGVMSGYIIYKNNGSLFKPETKADIERYFNVHVNALLTYLQGAAKPSDW